MLRQVSEETTFFAAWIAKGCLYSKFQAGKKECRAVYSCVHPPPEHYVCKCIRLQDHRVCMYTPPRTSCMYTLPKALCMTVHTSWCIVFTCVYTPPGHCCMQVYTHSRALYLLVCTPFRTSVYIYVYTSKSFVYGCAHTPQSIVYAFVYVHTATHSRTLCMRQITVCTCIYTQHSIAYAHIYT